MDPNMYSTEGAVPAEPPVGLRQLAAAVEELAAQDLHPLPDAVAAARVLVLRRLLDRLEGQWLRELAGVDGRGAAGAAGDTQALSTASWLRNQLRLGADAARQAVRTARSLFGGPLAGTAQALAAGELSAAHAGVLAAGTAELPAPPPWRRSRCCWRRPVGWTRGGCGGSSPTCGRSPTPTGPTRTRSGATTGGAVVGADLGGDAGRRGLLDPEAGQTLLAALEPLARPGGVQDGRSGWQRNADALAELARRSLEAGRLPRTGGCGRSCW